MKTIKFVLMKVKMVKNIVIVKTSNLKFAKDGFLNLLLMANIKRFFYDTLYIRECINFLAILAVECTYQFLCDCHLFLHLTNLRLNILLTNEIFSCCFMPFSVSHKIKHSHVWENRSMYSRHQQLILIRKFRRFATYY